MLAAEKPSLPAGQVWSPSNTKKVRPSRAEVKLPLAAAADVTAPQHKPADAAEARPAAGPQVRAGSLPVWLSAVAPVQGASAAREAAAPESGPAADGGSVQVTTADPNAAAAAGVPGGALTLAGDGAKPGTTLQVSLDLDELSGIGGNLAGRARLVALPSCALTTPQRAECQQRTAVASRYDASAKRLVAEVAVPQTTSAMAAPMTLGVATESSGGAGTYSATSLNPSTGWTAGGSSGAFTYSYPISVPASLGGAAPSVALSYDSSSVDGKTSSTNSQASWVGGDGWDFGAGFIERSFQPCTRAGLANSGDQCWGGANLTLSLAGHSGELVPDSATCNNGNANLEQSNCTWHLRSDDGTRIEFLTGAANGTWNGSYIKVTDSGGTAYYFGTNHLPGADGKASTVGPDTQSAWTVPVFSPKQGDPCYNSSTGQQSWCQMAWRWNLDAVVDVHGNLTTYKYDPETNWYKRGANYPGAGMSSYTRAGTLAEIAYGQLLSDQLGANGTYQSAARVVFTSGERCLTSTAACDPSQRTNANAGNWPDVPLDQQCDQATANCANISPTFWTSRWLNSIATQVRSNGSYRTVDSYQLNHVFLNMHNESENTQVPWLASIQRTAQNGQSPVVMPPVSFTYMAFANRVVGLGAVRPDYYRPRLTVVTTETGGTIGVVYKTADCVRNTDGTVPVPRDSNTTNCYNVKWYEPNKPQGTAPVDDWFQRYPVEAVTVDPKLVAGNKPQVTTYTYGNAAYHHNDAELADPNARTWDQFRGYAWVKTVAGTDFDTSAKSQSKTTYFQGMNGDFGSTGTRTVAGERSGPVTDDDWLAGLVLERDGYTSAGGSLVGSTVNISASPVTTATRQRPGLPDLVARYGSTVSTSITKSLKADGSWQTTGAVTTTDPAHGNRLLTSLSTADGTPDLCSRPSYATGSNPVMTGLVAQSLVISGPNACTVTPTTANTVSGARSLFDGQAYGTAGAKGNVSAAQVLERYDGNGNAQFTTVSTATVDGYGRVTSATDPKATDSAHPNGATTTTAYTSANAGELPNTITVTSPAPAGAPDVATGRTATATLDIGRGLELTTRDTNDRTTTKTYDALGRITAVWPTGRTTGDKPSATFSYAVNGTTGASTITSNTLHYDNNLYSTSIAITDGLGRTIQTQSTPAISGYDGRIVTDTFYDAQGHIFRSNPAYYNETSAPSTTWFDAASFHVPASTLTTYDGLGRPVSSEFRAKDERQNSTTTAYPGVDRVDVTPPTGATATTAVIDARGRTAQLWQYRTPTATGNPADADVTSYTYTPSGKPATRVDAARNTWSYGYDLLGRQTSADDPDTGHFIQSYDASGRLTGTTDARGQSLTYTYDLLGRRTASYASSTTDAAKQLTAHTYDTVAGAKGQPASSTRYVGGASGAAYTKAVTAYDTAYRATAVTTTIPGTDVGRTGTYSYSEQAGYHLINGALQQSIRGELGDLTQEILHYSYDSRGLMTSYGQIGGEQWMYDLATGYDAYGRAIRTTANPWGTQIVVTNTFDQPTGRQVSQFVDKQTTQTGAVQQTMYAYNQAGRITAITGIPNNTPSRTDRQCFTYDHLGRLTNAWTDTGAVAQQAPVGAIGNCANATPTSGAQAPLKTTVGGPGAYWQSYSYDAVGNRTQLVQHDTGGNTAADLTTNQIFPVPGTVNTGTGTGGPHALATAQNTSNGIPSPAGATQYDAAGNTTKVTDPASTRNLNGGWTLPSGQSITSNTTRLSMQADGNLVLTSLRTGAVTWSSGTWNHPGSSATMQTDGNFVIYDANRNPLWSTSTWNNNGAYLALQDDANLVIYKNVSAPNQNPIWASSTWNGIDADNATVITWNTEGKPATATTGGITTTYVYDADGSLIERSTPTQNTIVLGSNNDDLVYDKNAKTLTGTRYYSMPGGLSAVRTANSLNYRVSDHHGTETLALDATSLSETRNPVDPFGNPRTTNTATNGLAGTKGFVGGTKDTTTGLTNLGARQYQPTTGRFLSPDPIIDPADPQQWNPYAYSNNNPVNYSDANGLKLQCGGGDSPSCPTDNKAGGQGAGDLDSAYTTDHLTGIDADQAEAAGIMPVYPGVYVPANWDKRDQFANAYIHRIARDCKPYCGRSEEADLQSATALYMATCSDIGGCPNEVGTLKAALLSSVVAGLSMPGGRSIAGISKAIKDRAQRSVKKMIEARRQRLATSCDGDNSFPAGTKVLLADGTTRDINEVRVGDTVVATDPLTDETRPEEILAVIVTPDDKDFTDLTIQTSAGVEHLTSTQKHPFWNETTQQWTDAAKLRTGNHLRMPDGTPATITSVRSYTSLSVAYNLTVADLHTYYVLAGNTPVLVHNAGGPWCDTTKPIVGAMPDANQTSLYAIMSKDGLSVEKWGITGDPISRYSMKQYGAFGDGSYMQIIRNYDSRADALANERYLTKRWPGPWNDEPHAGTVTPTGGLVDVLNQIRAGRVLG
ncbi:RHS repeat-associated core domain-containing protein [Kitasatospora albolonga]|uniref:RHS repeat-associated core domain-containing protein n=2 Tax=Kitasatospora albolonga TaxID=68173 RepID=UPI0035EEF90C